MTDTSDATPRPDDMPEMMPSAKQRVERYSSPYYIHNFEASRATALAEECFRDGVLAERARTPEPSASALERARDLLTAIPGGPGYYDREVAAVAAAITEAETEARASVDPAAIRRAALIQEIVKVDDAWNVPEKLGEGAVAALMARRRAIVTEARALVGQPSSVQPEGWRSDMEAAPRDGAPLDLWRQFYYHGKPTSGSRCADAYYRADQGWEGWESEDGDPIEWKDEIGQQCVVTHWRLPPTPPAEDKINV